MKFTLLLTLPLLLGCRTVNNIAATSQVLNYAKDPNAEKVVPHCPCLPAIAYSKDVSGPVYYWNMDLQVWK